MDSIDVKKVSKEYAHFSREALLYKIATLERKNDGLLKLLGTFTNMESKHEEDETIVKK